MVILISDIKKNYAVVPLAKKENEGADIAFALPISHQENQCIFLHSVLPPSSVMQFSPMNKPTNK